MLWAVPGSVQLAPPRDALGEHVLVMAVVANGRHAEFHVQVTAVTVQIHVVVVQDYAGDTVVE